MLLILFFLSFCIRSPCFPSTNSSVLILFLIGKVITGITTYHVHHAHSSYISAFVSHLLRTLLTITYLFPTNTHELLDQTLPNFAWTKLQTHRIFLVMLEAQYHWGPILSREEPETGQLLFIYIQIYF